MATNMIPHNLGEVVAAARWLINHPDADPGQADGVRPRPRPAHRRSAARPGRGAPGVRDRAAAWCGCAAGSRSARWRAAAAGRRITVTELPYGVGAEKVIEAITDEVRGKMITAGPRRASAAGPAAGHRRRQGPHRPGERHPAGHRVQGRRQPAGAAGRPLPAHPAGAVLRREQPGAGRRAAPTLGLKALLEVFLAHRYEVVTRRSDVPPPQAAGAAAPGRRPADRPARHRQGGPADPGQRQRAGRQGRR